MPYHSLAGALSDEAKVSSVSPNFVYEDKSRPTLATPCKKVRTGQRKVRTLDFFCLPWGGCAGGSAGGMQVGSLARAAWCATYDTLKSPEWDASKRLGDGITGGTTGARFLVNYSNLGSRAQLTFGDFRYGTVSADTLNSCKVQPEVMEQSLRIN